jgi:nitroreductase
MDFFDAIALRQSVRKYTEQQVAQDDIDKIVAAGCAAPVGMGAFKSMRIAVIQDPDFLERLNKAGAQAMGRPDSEMSVFHKAPTLIAIFHEEPRMPGIDFANAACVVENMALAAAALGLGSVYLFMPNGAFASDPSLAADLGIPEGFKAVSHLAVGHPADQLEQRDVGLRIEVVQK